MRSRSNAAASARLALIDCGHEVPIEAPRELAALIEAFLAGLGAATKSTETTDVTASVTSG